MLLIGVPWACVVPAVVPSVDTGAFKRPCWKSGHIRADI